ncbi:hypothetical protein ALTERO38_51961 [Alteromonas sp. 38]|nr:hypothetical protein ALTERO38_51961 [Alteromonas sp. 38]
MGSVNCYSCCTALTIRAAMFESASYSALSYDQMFYGAHSDRSYPGFTD